ncbi:hypothetical protein AB0F17_11855 [Nonomuraea sp. NPDC026600]|jgi:hypothetical protein|uniref:hypothetical protein n=1 Tax=Nonomuraea sp. NPDC026600 TaxID=3155363 RepID=UPI0033E8F0F4
MRIWRIALALMVSTLLSATMTPAALAAPTAKKVLVELREQGGFAGFDNRVIVYTNGCVRLSRRTGPTVDKCLTSGEKRKLHGELKKLRLGHSEAQPQGADFLKYTLTYKGHRVSRYTLTRTWTPVVHRLERFLVKYWAPD